MTKIIIKLGRRATDSVVIEVENITDAAEIYDAVLEATGDHAKAALAVEKVDNLEFDIYTGK